MGREIIEEDKRRRERIEEDERGREGIVEDRRGREEGKEKKKREWMAKNGRRDDIQVFTAKNWNVILLRRRTERRRLPAGRKRI